MSSSYDFYTDICLSKTASASDMNRFLDQYHKCLCEEGVAIYCPHDEHYEYYDKSKSTSSPAFERITNTRVLAESGRNAAAAINNIINNNSEDYLDPSLNHDSDSYYYPHDPDYYKDPHDPYSYKDHHDPYSLTNVGLMGGIAAMGVTMLFVVFVFYQIRKRRRGSSMRSMRLRSSTRYFVQCSNYTFTFTHTLHFAFRLHTTYTYTIIHNNNNNNNNNNNKNNKNNKNNIKK